MPATLLVDLPGRSVTVRELTVAEVRDWLVAVESGATFDVIQALSFDECGLDDIARMCDATAKELEVFAPSDLAPVMDACKALNPHFFRVRAALSGAARAMVKQTS